MIIVYFRARHDKEIKKFPQAINFSPQFSQRFKFCGDGDCPDYILAAIHSNLCGLSSVKLKVFASQVVKIILSEQPIEDEKFADAFGGRVEDAKSAYSCVRFLLLSAVRFGIEKDVFAIELQQLGLPREHSLALGKVLNENSAALRENLKSKSLTINELADVRCRESDGIDCVKLEMEIKNFIGAKGNVTKEINISKSDIPVLLKELKIIKSKMDQLDYENQ